MKAKGTLKWKREWEEKRGTGAVQVTQEFRCEGAERNGISHAKWVKRNLFPFKTGRIITFFHVD